MRRLLACLLLALVALPAWAQPSGAEIIQTAIDRYAERMADVDNYTVTQTMSMMNMEVTTYHERDPDGGPLAYTTTTYMNGRPNASGPSDQGDPYAALACMKDHATYAGTETVDGEETYAVRIDDFGDCADEMGMTGQEGMEDGQLESGTMFLDTDDYVLRRMTMDGTMTAEGRTADFTMTMTMSDYRSVDGMLHPFKMEMVMTGMEAMMGEDQAETRAQLEELKARMDEMPASMRGMLEDQIAQLEAMTQGEGMTLSMDVTDVAVNAGPPGDE